MHMLGVISLHHQTRLDLHYSDVQVSVRAEAQVRQKIIHALDTTDLILNAVSLWL